MAGDDEDRQLLDPLGQGAFEAQERPDLLHPGHQLRAAQQRDKRAGQLAARSRGQLLGRRALGRGQGVARDRRQAVIARLAPHWASIPARMLTPSARIMVLKANENRAWAVTRPRKRLVVMLKSDTWQVAPTQIAT